MHARRLQAERCPPKEDLSGNGTKKKRTSLVYQQVIAICGYYCVVQISYEWVGSLTQNDWQVGVTSIFVGSGTKSTNELEKRDLNDCVVEGDLKDRARSWPCVGTAS
jgi:hypothetical protein|mmetsp:Transcript_97833/g.164794  ORF Transcript_97833/g.164794 Transcript_97833/m.164794 type:complete len:107 (-) Transcript_97833:354-674(-)